MRNGHAHMTKSISDAQCSSKKSNVKFVNRSGESHSLHRLGQYQCTQYDAHDAPVRRAKVPCLILLLLWRLPVAGLLHRSPGYVVWIGVHVRYMQKPSVELLLRSCTRCPAHQSSSASQYICKRLTRQGRLKRSLRRCSECFNRCSRKQQRSPCPHSVGRRWE